MFDHFSCEHIERDALNTEVPLVLAAYRAAADSGIPDYSSFCPDRLPAYRDSLAVAERLPDGDFICRHFGANLVQRIGFDITGLPISKGLGPNLSALVKRMLVEALSRRKPLLERHYASQTPEVALWEGLHCPVWNAGELSTVVIFFKPAELRNEMLGAIVDAAPMGVLAYRVLRNGTGKITDARLILMNRAATSIVGLSSEKIGKSIFEITPTAMSRGIWDRYVRVVETRRTEHYESQADGDPDGPWLRLTVIPWQDGFIVMFNDITEIRSALAMLENQARDLRFQVGVEQASRSALAAQLQSAVQRERALLVVAQSDSLTQIFNRRGFETAVTKLIAEGSDRCGGVHFALIDIDYFKTVNDRWGHAAGDEVLKTFAERLTEASLETGAIVARIGGEEFAICLRLPDDCDADDIMVGLQRRLTNEAFPLGNGLAIALTCSVGFSMLAADELMSACIARADAALYDAKRFGRNRVSVSRAA